jgi:hypothetical protein
MIVAENLDSVVGQFADNVVEDFSVEHDGAVSAISAETVFLMPVLKLYPQTVNSSLAVSSRPSNTEMVLLAATAWMQTEMASLSTAFSQENFIVRAPFGFYFYFFIFSSSNRGCGFVDNPPFPLGL